jgi:hypothetical protein
MRSVALRRSGGMRILGIREFVDVNVFFGYTSGRHVKVLFVLVFHIFLHENTLKQHDFITIRKLRAGHITIASLQNSLKREGAYHTRAIDTGRPQKITDRLPK